MTSKNLAIIDNMAEARDALREARNMLETMTAQLLGAGCDIPKNSRLALCFAIMKKAESGLWTAMQEFYEENS